MHLPGSEVFDVSLGGAVTLLNCHFSNISTAGGLVDTTFNDYLLSASDHTYRGLHYGDRSVDSAVYGADDHEAYDIALAPAPERAALAYGSDYVVVNETMGDCQFDGLSENVLQRCSEQLSAHTLSAPPEAAPISSGVQAEMYRRSGLVISGEQGLRYDAGFAVPVLMS